MKISLLKHSPNLYFFLFLVFLIPKGAWAGCGKGYKNTTLNVSFNKCNSELVINDLKIYEYNLGKDDYADYVKVYLYRYDAWELVWLIQKDTTFNGATLHPRENRNLYYGNVNSGNFSTSIVGRDVDSWWVFANLNMKGIPQDIVNSGKVKIRVEALMYNSCKDTLHELYDNSWTFDIPEIAAPINLQASQNKCNSLELSWKNGNQVWEKDSACLVTGNYQIEILNEDQVLASLPLSAGKYVDESFYEGKQYSYTARILYRFFDESSMIYSGYSNLVKSTPKAKPLETVYYTIQKNTPKNKFPSSIDSLIKINKELTYRLSLKENETLVATKMTLPVEKNNTMHTNNSLDSIININNNLLGTIAWKDSVIASLKSTPKLEENQNTEINEELSTSADGDFIVVGVYPSYKLAKYNQQKHGYQDFEIVKSKSGKWYYIAAPLKESDQVLSALKNIRNSITKNAWWLKLE